MRRVAAYVFVTLVPLACQAILGDDDSHGAATGTSDAGTGGEAGIGPDAPQGEVLTGGNCPFGSAPERLEINQGNVTAVARVGDAVYWAAIDANAKGHVYKRSAAGVETIRDTEYYQAAPEDLLVGTGLISWVETVAYPYVDRPPDVNGATWIEAELDAGITVLDKMGGRGGNYVVRAAAAPKAAFASVGHEGGGSFILKLGPNEEWCATGSTIGPITSVSGAAYFGINEEVRAAAAKDVGGCELRPLVAKGNGNVLDFAIGRDRLYWITNTRKLYRAEATIPSSPPPEPAAWVDLIPIDAERVAADDRCVYIGGKDSILGVPFDAPDLKSDIHTGGAKRIWADSSGVYWATDTGEIWRRLR
jgi:hypothetical protein